MDVEGFKSMCNSLGGEFTKHATSRSYICKDVE